MNRSVLRAAAIVLAAGVLAAIPACGGGGGSGAGKVKVAIVTNMTADFWSVCEAGAKKGAADFDVDVIFRQPKDNTVADQMEIVDAVQKLGISGLAVSVIKPDDQAADLKRIGGKVNLITLDTDAPDSGRLCFVGVDNFLAGQDAGRLVKQALPDGGTVALFIGNTTQSNSKGRIAGVLSELGGTDVRKDVEEGKYADTYGKYTLYRKEPITDGGKEDKALSNAGDSLEVLKDKPNVCLVGLFAYDPKAIVEAVRSKKLVGKVKVVGFDEDLVTLEAIEKGEMVGSISQDPYNYGYESVKWLAKLARGEAKKADLPQTPTPHKLVLKAADTPKAAGSTAPVESASKFAEKIRDALSKK